MLNKIELIGPVIDSYIKHIGYVIDNKLSRSKNTGLMLPIPFFVPWSIFCHLCILVVGYGGDMRVTERKIVLTISSCDTANKVFSPVQMKRKNCLKAKLQVCQRKRKHVNQFTRRASVMVTTKSPIQFSYNRKQEIAVISVYVQRYDANDFAIDLSLQKIISLVEYQQAVLGGDLNELFKVIMLKFIVLLLL